MRKTVSITVAGQLFHIEEEAYAKLDAYLSSVRKHFSGYEDKDEIVSDIEGRIAERFAEKRTKAKNVVAEKEVDDLIEHMGTVKDFEEFEQEGHAHEEESKAGFFASKRLYRDGDDVMIAGVASGLAKWLGVDPTPVRLAFLISLIFGGAGILVYIVLWIVMPLAKTTSEKVEMRGQKLTLKRIEAAVRENIPAMKDKVKPGTLKRIVQFPFAVIRQVLRFIGRVVRAIVPILGRILGVLLVVVSTAAMFALSFAAIMFASGAWEPYMEVPVRELAGDVPYFTVIASAFIAGFAPGVAVFIAGLSLALMRNMFRFQAAIGLFALWVLALLLGAVTLGKELPSLAPRIESYVESHDAAVTKTLELEAFESIDVRGGYDVRVRAGESDVASVSGSQKAVDELRITVEEGTLTIRREYRGRMCIICLDDDAVIDLAVADGDIANLIAGGGARIDVDGVNAEGESVAASGGARIEIKNADVSDILAIETEGGGVIDIVAQNDVESLTMKGSGGSHLTYAGNATAIDLEIEAGTVVRLSGSGRTLDVHVSSGSDVRAIEFTVVDAVVQAESGGVAEITVTGSLRGEADSGGAIRYEGNPPIVEVDASPSGDVVEYSEEEAW